MGTTIGACKINAHDKDAKTYAYLHTSLRPASDSVPLAQIFNMGKGKVAVLGMDIGTQYYDGMQYLQVDLIKNLANDLYTPIAKVESVCGNLEIVCLEKDGKLMLQLVNMNGDHNNLQSATTRIIPPIVDAKLSIKRDKKPSKLIFQPAGKEIDFEWIDGKAYFTIDRIDMHNVVEVVD